MPASDPRALLTEPYSEEPWWWQDARPQERPVPDLPSETDVAVVGSGYTGLCCALTLARAGTDVTVFDAGAIGSGASSRNAGFLSGRAGVSKQINLEAAVGVKRAAAILEEADEAYEGLQDFLSVEAIDCDFQPCGRFVGAHTPAAFDKLSAKMAEYNSDGRKLFEMISPADQKDFIDSPLYYGGMLIKNAGTIHPGRYHRGLVALCEAAGVRFVPQTRVTRLARDGTKHRVTTDRGTVTARHVALGTNGYTDSASPWHQRRVIPISSTIIATEDLGPDRVRSLLPRLCPVIDTKRVIYFARPTPNHRAILFGGRARFTPVGPLESVRILHGQMTEMFPDLADVRISHTWSGFMGFTFDFLPKLGRHEDVHYAIGCNGGSGIVMMSWLGHQMARGILGTANRASAFEGLPFKTQPFYSGTPWFLPIVGTWYRFRDWLDMRGRPPVSQ
ncbi:MAG: FAD-binding oxidoreductase [Pseudomonadota bacterium]